jgi:hypothetical protein
MEYGGARRRVGVTRNNVELKAVLIHAKGRGSSLHGRQTNCAAGVFA